MKRFVFLVLFALIVHPCFSQQNGNSILKDLGVFAGPGFSTILGSESWKGTFGFIVGVDTKIFQINEKSAITAGIGFSLQGAAWEEDYPSYYSFNNLQKSGLSTSSSETLSGKVSLVYLFFPILYQYQFDNGIYCEAGLQPGFLLSAKDKYNDESYDYKEYVKTFDLAIPVGAGYKLNEKLSLGGRVSFGVTNLDNSDGDSSDHNFMFVAILRYAFNSEEN